MARLPSSGGAIGIAKERVAYTHPRTGSLTTIDELVPVTNPDSYELWLREADVLCWGVLASGRHPVLVSQ